MLIAALAAAVLPPSSDLVLRPHPAPAGSVICQPTGRQEITPVADRPDRFYTQKDGKQLVCIRQPAPRPRRADS